MVRWQYPSLHSQGGNRSLRRYQRNHRSVYRANTLFDNDPADPSLRQAGALPHRKPDGRLAFYTVMAAQLLYFLPWEHGFGLLRKQVLLFPR